MRFLRWDISGLHVLCSELWGGPSNTYKYLTDSDLDWAQQLRRQALLDQRG
jgi:hypothetical protein